MALSGLFSASMALENSVVRAWSSGGVRVVLRRVAAWWMAAGIRELELGVVGGGELGLEGEEEVSSLGLLSDVLEFGGGGGTVVSSSGMLKDAVSGGSFCEAVLACLTCLTTLS